MRTGNLSTLSTRDWESIRARRAWEKEEREKELLADDRIEYQKFVQIVEDSQRRVAPAYRIEPITFEEWRTHADPAISDPLIRGAQATNAALLRKVRTDEAAEQEAELKASREAVLADQPDPAWRIPDSAAGIKMSVDAARSFAKTEADAFLTATPSYYPCKKNWDLMRGYLEAQGVNIPDRNVFAAAFARLSELGLLEQTALEPTPEPAPEPEPDQQPIDTVSAEMELLDGWDLQTGEPHKYRLYEVNRMSADEYRLAFRVSPRFTRGYFG